jgi:hypothetical protein
MRDGCLRWLWGIRGGPRLVRAGLTIRRDAEFIIGLWHGMLRDGAMSLLVRRVMIHVG